MGFVAAVFLVCVYSAGIVKFLQWWCLLLYFGGLGSLLNEFVSFF